MPERDDPAELDSRAIAIAGEVLELNPDERELAIASRCGAGELADRVRAVISAGSSMGSFMDVPAFVADVDRPGERQRLGLAAHTPIGEYRTVRLVGSGSMGDVYEAEPRSGGARVALKIVRPGAVPREYRRRFDFEVSTLARLRHPNIARLIDSGVHPGEDGDRPYLVMEFVDGRTVVEHANERALRVADRVGMFLGVCDAVGHAHRSGVIHRDLKPANILVDAASGAPKVLDFGVARAIDPMGTLSSMPGEHLVGSLPYMSPEQAGRSDRGPVDTRADVYSLGAVLYELLAGVPPHRPDGHSLAEFIRVVQERDPPRLGMLVPAIRGELEVIVHAALAHDPRVRYQSVEGLADDLRRYLRGDPLTIKPPRAAYLLRKLAERHRAAMVVAVIIAGVLAAAVAFGGYQLVRARRAEQKSETYLQQVIVASRSMMVDVNGKLREQGQPLEARRIALQATMEYLERVRSEVGDDPRVLTEVVRSYVRLGQAIGSAGDASLGDSAGALELFRRASVLGEAVLRDHPSPELHRGVSEALEEQAVHSSAGEQAVLFREAARHTLAAARTAGDSGLRERDERRALQLLLRAATTEQDAPAVEAIIGKMRAITARRPEQALLWSEQGLAERFLGELLVEREPDRSLEYTRASIASFQRSIALGLDEFTNNRHIAKAQVALVKLLAGRSPAAELLSMIESGIARSRRASAFAGTGNMGRVSHLQTLVSVVHRGLELSKAIDPSVPPLASGDIAAQVAGMVRTELEAMTPLESGVKAHPLEQEVLHHIEESLRLLDGPEARR